MSSSNVKSEASPAVKKVATKSIKKQVLIYAMFLVLAIVFQGAFSYFGSSQIKSQSTSIKDANFPAQQLMDRFTYNFKEMQSSMEKVIMGDVDEDQAAEIQEAIEVQGNQALSRLDSIGKISKSPDVDNLKKLFTSYKTNASNAISAKVDGESPDATTLEALAKTAGITDLVEKIKKDKQTKINDSFKSINEKAGLFIVVALACILILSLIVFMFIRYTSVIAKSVRLLADDANIIRGGKLDHKIERTREDELGVLQTNFDLMRCEVKDFIENLDLKVKERTKEVMEEKRKIADLLNNMKQAVFKIDANLNVVAPVSRYAQDVFEENIVGKSIWETVYKDIEPGTEMFSAVTTAFIAVFGEDELQWDLSEDNLARKFHRINAAGEKQILRVNYAPLWDENDNLQEIMLVVEDITELEKLAEEKRSNEESITIIQNISSANLEDLKGYFISFKQMLKQIEDIVHAGVFNEDTLGLMFRYFHTLKGNSRVFGLSLVSTAVHHVENHVTECQKFVKAKEEIDPDFAQHILDGAVEIQSVVDRYIDISVRIFKMNHAETSDESISVDKSQYDKLQIKLSEFKTTMGDHDEVDELLTVFNSLLKMDLKGSFEKYNPMVAELNEKLNKMAILTVDGDDVRVGREQLNTMHDAFIHMIRNSMDHGLEETSARLQIGKPEQSTIHIGIKLLDGGFEVVIEDDGKGIPIDLIAKKAVLNGAISQVELDKMSDAEKTHLIFLPNVSSKDEISELSGRGVGMDVVKKNIEGMGGVIEVTTAHQKGTKFTFTFKSEL